ncbi:MLO-like protein [Rhynchospora pubera]|uniref:MLO-like protein n=1 Tax=Rhynchospora pubera TaxID=906938 RepID=A0AAV8C495_9POAL|nr:MLO-like protein [Rhynchospora pubera]
MAGGGGGETKITEITFEYTPTWFVAAVCSLIVIISLILERLLHRAGKVLKRGNRKTMFGGLQKIKEVLTLLGYISLLLTVIQITLTKICVKKSIMHHWLPCKIETHASSTKHLAADFFTGVLGGDRRLLAGGGGGGSDHCTKKVLS